MMHQGYIYIPLVSVNRAGTCGCLLETSWDINTKCWTHGFAHEDEYEAECWQMSKIEGLLVWIGDRQPSSPRLCFIAKAAIGSIRPSHVRNRMLAAFSTSREGVWEPVNLTS